MRRIILDRATDHIPIIEIKIGKDYEVGRYVGSVTSNVVGSKFFPESFPVIFGISKETNDAFLFAKEDAGFTPIVRITTDGEGHRGLYLLVSKITSFFDLLTNRRDCLGNRNIIGEVIDNVTDKRTDVYTFIFDSSESIHSARIIIPDQIPVVPIEEIGTLSLEAGIMMGACSVSHSGQNIYKEWQRDRIPYGAAIPRI